MDAIKNDRNFGLTLAVAHKHNIDIGEFVVAKLNHLAQEMRRSYRFQVHNYLKEELPRPYQGMYTSKYAFDNALLAIDQRSLEKMTPAERAALKEKGIVGWESTETLHPTDFAADMGKKPEVEVNVPDDIMVSHMRAYEEEAAFRSQLTEEEVLADIYNIKAELIQENAERIATGDIPLHTRDLSLIHI